MTEKSLTLLEFHLDDSRIQIGPRSMSAGASETESGDSGIDVIGGTTDSEDGEESEDIEVSGGTHGSHKSVFGSAGKAVISLVVLAGLALAVWKLLGKGDLEAVEELDELRE